MKFTVGTTDFKSAMSIAGRVIPQKTPWPIVTNVKIDAGHGQLTLRGTNGDLTLEFDVDADVEETGTALVPFAILSKFISAAKGDTSPSSASPVRFLNNCRKP